MLHDARGFAVTVSYTVLLWLMVATAHLLVVRAFGIHYEQVPFTGAVFVMGLSMLGSVVPTPGGATGPFHIATAASLSFLGVDKPQAASVAIVLHLVIFTPATFFGLYSLAKEGLSLDRLKRLGERQVEEVDQLEELTQRELRETPKRWLQGEPITHCRARNHNPRETHEMSFCATWKTELLIPARAAGDTIRRRRECQVRAAVYQLRAHRRNSLHGG